MPRGEAAEVRFLDDVWEVTVLNVVPNAWPQIQSENRYNDPPEAERQFYMVSIRAKNIGTDRALFISSELRSVGNAIGVVYTTFQDSCGVIPNDIRGEVLPTFQIEGNVCWHIASKDLDTLLMFWDGSEILGASDVWFALR